MRDLRLSHFLPSALWKGARTPGRKNANPVIVTRRNSQTSSMEMKAHLLCGECEARLNENGEREALRWIAPKAISRGRFPVGDRLNLAFAHRRTPPVTAYRGSAVGIDTEKLAYFALSILWRAAVHRWPLPDGSGVTSAIDLGEYEEPIRKYLLDAPFPDGVAVVLTVCTDSVSRNILATPTQISGGPFNMFRLQTYGLHFSILTGKNLGLEIRELCCVSSGNKWIFAASRAGQTVQAVKSLLATSRPAPNLL